MPSKKPIRSSHTLRPGCADIETRRAGGTKYSQDEAPAVRDDHKAAALGQSDAIRVDLMTGWGPELLDLRDQRKEPAGDRRDRDAEQHRVSFERTWQGLVEIVETEDELPVRRR